MRAGRYWMRLSRFLMIAASWWGVLHEPRLPRLFFMVDHAPSHRVELGSAGGQLDDGQPIWCAQSRERIWALNIQL